MITFINLLTLSRIFLAAIIFILLTSSDGYLMALILFFLSAFFKLTSKGIPSDDKICSVLIIKKGGYIITAL